MKESIESLCSTIKKYGWGIIFGIAFFYYAYKTDLRYEKLQNDYNISQKEDRRAYVKTLEKVVETLTSMNESIDIMSANMKAMEGRIKDLEMEVRHKPITQTTIVGDKNVTNKQNSLKGEHK